MTENDTSKHVEAELTEEIKDLTSQLEELSVKIASKKNQLQVIKDKRRAQQRLNGDSRRNEQAARDHHGELIVLGDTVLFLTPGLFKSTHGVVIKISKSRITARDKSGRSINRAPHNVAVVFEA